MVGGGRCYSGREKYFYRDFFFLKRENKEVNVVGEYF